MKRFKSWIIGGSVVLFNIGTSLTQVIKPERCTGSCASCGYSCAQNTIGLVGIGALVVFYQKIKKKINNIKLSKS